jgi:hypothetical protein
LIWVGEVVYTGIGIINKPKDEYLELEGAVGTEEGGPPYGRRIGGWRLEPRYLDYLFCAIDGMQLAMGELFVG